MTVSTIPEIHYDVAFNADPNQAVLPPYWTDLTTRFRWGWGAGHGSLYETDVNETGTMTAEVWNGDGALDPLNTASPFSPNVIPYRRNRIRVVLGGNLLQPDQASAGEWSPIAPGPVPPQYQVSAGPNVVTVAAVGGAAFQGTQVFVTAVGAGTSHVLDVAIPQVTAGQQYTFTAQAQIPAGGTNQTVNAAIDWIGINGAVLSTSSGSGTLLTAGAGTWTALTVAGAQAPAAAVAATVRVVSAVTGAVTIWTDGLQLEARGYATRWQMPWQTGVNGLPQTIATGLETMNPVTGLVASWFTAAGPSAGALTRATNLSAAPTGGTTAVGWPLPSGTTTGMALYAGGGATTGPVADCTQITAGLVYSGSVYLTRTGPDATVTIAVNLTWFNAAGTSLGTVTGTAATVPTAGWVRASIVNQTAPAGAVWGRMWLSVATPATFTGAETVNATGWQLEQAAAVSTWADPGVVAQLFNGMVERWPQIFKQADGTLGTSPLECVDAFAGLAQFGLQAPFVNELLALGPNFLYQLNDPAGSTQAADTTGKRRPAPVEQSPYGAGSLTFGTAMTAASLPSGGFVGAPGPVATFNNNSANTGQLQETFVSLHKTTIAPGPPAQGGWTRIIAFRVPTAPSGSNQYALWWATATNSNCQALFTVISGGNFGMQFTDSAGFAWSSSPVTGLCDGNWHLAAMSIAPGSSGTFSFWVDGVSANTGSGNIGTPAGITNDVVGCFADPLRSAYYNGYKGDLADVVELPFAITSAQMTNLYNSWRNASSGESSGARFNRVLTWVGYVGPTAVDAGQTQSMGPATDLTGNSALDALNLIALTENGNQFVAKDGTLTFKSRAAFYNSRVPVVTFGEGLPVGNAGEWPCELGSFDFDPSHLANGIQVTVPGGSTYQAANSTSRQKFFPRAYTRQINTTSSSEPQDAATYLLGQMAQPKQRVEVIQIHPAAQPGLFPIAAQLEIGQRIRLVKRPIGAPPTTLDLFIRKVDWSWSPNVNDVFVEFQASPADLTAYGVLGALHTTLNAQATAGQATATINALPDAAYNKLAQSLPSGYSLRFEPGTARDETLTLAPGGIPSTVLGYASATLTFASNFTFTHPANSVVCEPLPTGYTDPTTWDASAVIGAASTTVLSGGASGTNTVTVGPLPDAAYNSLSQTWNTGDTIQLSPGTPNSETAVIQSVATTYPGYTSCLITLTANLAHTHAANDTVCDPLPAGINTPAAITPTLKLSY